MDSKKLMRTAFVIAVITVLLSALPHVAAAQGSIFGSVTRAGGTVPENGLVSFFGYLDDTDEEIRIETSVGAGYDAGNWFDDFQNYQTEAAGNPYDFHFFDLGQGEGFVLSGLIPDNSFQQEDITLGSVTWPLPPIIISGRFTPEGTIEIVWVDDPTTTVHVYRRIVPSEGSFFRVDDPTGSLADPGVVGDRIVDADVDTASGYQYLLIAEDAAAQLSPHSEIVTVTYEGGCCVVRGDINHSGAMPLDIGDLVFLVDYMFTGGAEPVCIDEADVNGDGLLTIDIADLVYLVDYMFLSAPPPPPCQ